MTKVSRRKPGIKARALASVGVGVLGVAICIATGGSKPAEAAPVVLTFTGQVFASNEPGANDGDPITFKVFADNGGTSLISQTWDVTDILSSQITAGSYSGTTSGAIDSFPNSSGSFTTDATGHLASLFFVVAQNGTDSNGLADKFFSLMNGFNNIWGIPGESFGAVSPPTINNTSIALAPTPIPAALPLFASALGGLGFVGWRRRRAASAG